MNDQLDLFGQPAAGEALAPPRVNPRRPKPEEPDDTKAPTVDEAGVVTCPKCGELFEDPEDVGWHCPSKAWRCVKCKPPRGPLFPGPRR